MDQLSQLAIVRPAQSLLHDSTMFSIEIEDGELAVLSTFPFDRFEIGASSVEVIEASSQIARSCPSPTTSKYGSARVSAYSFS
jgi:hypothetical protein